VQNELLRKRAERTLPVSRLFACLVHCLASYISVMTEISDMTDVPSSSFFEIECRAVYLKILRTDDQTVSGI
jgi:hypothetical protein